MPKKWTEEEIKRLRVLIKEYTIGEIAIIFNVNRRCVENILYKHKIRRFKPRKPILVECSFCGKKLKRDASQINNSNEYFCNKKEKGAYMSLKYGENRLRAARELGYINLGGIYDSRRKYISTKRV